MVNEPYQSSVAPVTTMPAPSTDFVQPIPPRRVLLVEPSEFCREQIRDELIGANLEIGEAGDLASAVEAVSTFHPEVILAQLRLGSRDGLELVRWLKDDRETQSIPVILYGDNAMASDRIGAYDLDAADVLSPRLVGAELIARVRAALRDRDTRIALEHRAYRDALTGLLNRAALDDQLLREWSSSRRRGTALSVLVVDLDNLKQINDTYGHAVGDVALRRVAEVLAGSVRNSDLVARVGGDEFVVVAPGCPPDHAGLVATRLRAGLAAAPIVVPGAPATVFITASVGIAGIGETAQGNAEELFLHADQALYHAKKSGRDAVAIHDLSRGAPMVVANPGTNPEGN